MEQGNIEQLMGTVGTPTLKAIAAVFGLQAIRLYTVAKQPKAGEVFDPHVYNWDAIERFILRRLPVENGPQTLEEVLIAALAIDVELKNQDGRRSSSLKSTKEMITVDGREIPKRKYPNFEADAGKPIVLKKDPMVYGIVYQTVSHTVLRPVTRENEFCADEVKVISNLMLNMKGVAGDFLEGACEERWSGKYAEKLAAEAAKVASKPTADPGAEAPERATTNRK